MKQKQSKLIQRLQTKHATYVNLLVPQNYPFNTGSKQNHTRHVWGKAVKNCYSENTQVKHI